MIDSTLLKPTLAGFILFIRGTMGIDPLYLPDNSPVIEMSYDIACATTNLYLRFVSPLLGTLAIYNLAGDTLINFAPDQPLRSYFFDLRVTLGISVFVPGVIASSSDSGTSASSLNPEFMKTFTLANLQNLKTPYGRQYLALAQSYGSLWGLS